MKIFQHQRNTAIYHTFILLLMLLLGGYNSMVKSYLIVEGARREILLNIGSQVTHNEIQRHRV